MGSVAKNLAILQKNGNITSGILIYYKQINNDTKSNNYNLKRQ